MAVFRTIVAVVIAYTIACAVVVLIWQTANRDPFTAEALAAGMALALIFSAPGFVLLRLLLWSAGQRHLIAFAFAGAINGPLALVLCIREIGFDPYFALMGVAAGGAYWLVERAIAGEVLARSLRPKGRQA